MPCPFHHVFVFVIVITLLLLLLLLKYRSWVIQSVQRLATGWTIGVLGVRLPTGAGNFSLLYCFQTGFGAQWLLGALSPRMKWPGREADHSPPSSDEIKNAWSYTSTSLSREYVFIVWCLIKYRTRLHGMVLS